MNKVTTEYLPPVGSLVTDIDYPGGKIKVSWLGIHHFKVEYFCANSTDATRTYEVVTAVGNSSDTLLNQSQSAPYPGGYETVTIIKNGKKWAHAAYIGFNSSKVAVDGLEKDKDYKIEFFNDDEGVEQKRILYTALESGVEEILSKTIVVDAGIVSVESGAMSSGVSDIEGDKMPARQVSYGSRFQKPEQFDGVDQMSSYLDIYSFGQAFFFLTSDPLRLHNRERISYSDVRYYNEDFLANPEYGQWKHLPFSRYPKKLTLSGSSWFRSGEEKHFDQGGNLTEHRFKIAGMEAIRNVTVGGNKVTDILKIGEDALEFTNVETIYENGLSKATSTVADVDTTVNYYTEDTSDGFAWMVKSVTTPTGVTSYRYSRVTTAGANEGEFTVIATYNPVSSSTDTVTTTTVNKYGHLISSKVKSGSIEISSITASDHTQNIYMKPEKLTVVAGGVTKEVSLKYNADGSIKTVNNTTDGVINKYVWDILGRLKGGTDETEGTTFDGLAYEPDHSHGFTSSQYSLGGKKITTSTDVYGQLKKFSHELGIGYSVTQDVDNKDQYTSAVPEGADRKSESVFRSDGLLDEVKGGMGSPGVSYDYGLATVNGVNCLKITRTFLNALNNPSSYWEASYYDGYGRLIRAEEPHPNGFAETSQTNYSYDVSERKITITPPAPFVKITKVFSPDWKQVTITQGAITQGAKKYTSTTEVIAGTVKKTIKKGAREIYSEQINLATGHSSRKVERRNEVKRTISEGGKRVTIEGPDSFLLTANYGKYGLENFSGSSRNQDFSGSIENRDVFGRVTQAKVKPPGASGDYNIGILASGRLGSIVGPGMNTALNYTFEGGGVKVTASNTVTGDATILGADAHGQTRNVSAPGRPPLQITGDALAGNFTVKVPEQAGQQVNYITGPRMNILSKTRSDSSGVSYGYHASGAIKNFTRFDGASNGGAAYVFNLTHDEESGLPTGYNGTDCSLVVGYNDDGQTELVTYKSKGMNDNWQEYSCNYQNYADETPGLELYGGLLGGYKVVRQFHTSGVLVGKLDYINLYSGDNLVHSVKYQSDGYGRIEKVTASVGKTFQSDYGYLSGHLKTVTSGAVTATRYTLADGSLSSLSTETASANYSAAYSYDSGTQKRNGLSISATGRPQLDWTYSFLGNQLQNAEAKEGQVVKHGYDYAHNIMGNRTGVITSVNSYNQYEVIKVPGMQSYIVRGRVEPGASVTVKRNGGSADSVLVAPDGTFSATYQATTTGASPVAVPIEVIGTLPGAGVNGSNAVAKENRTVVLRPSEWSMTYGAHGALGSDWRWLYRWNSEGRLSGLETRTTAITAGLPNLKLKFAYDDKGRRIQKTVIYLTSNSSSSTRTVTTKFVYDNWNLIGEFISDTQNGVSSRFYTWGANLDGSLQGMGGVGGLLAVHQDGESYVPSYDGNGNIIALCDASTGAEKAYWSRGPFGEQIEASGDTKLCPFGFATHYRDSETGLIYFGYRYYSPLTGRWISREPLGEFESFNLYAYCHNDPVNKVDRLGLDAVVLERSSAIRGLADVFYIMERQGEGLENVRNFFDSEVTRIRVGSVSVNQLGDPIGGVSLRPGFGGGRMEFGKLKAVAANNYYDHSLLGAGDYVRGMLRQIGSGKFDSINEPLEFVTGGVDKVVDGIYGVGNFAFRPFRGRDNPMFPKFSQMRDAWAPGWSARVNNLSAAHINGGTAGEYAELGFGVYQFTKLGVVSVNRVRRGTGVAIRGELDEIRRIAPDAQVGYRGSLARGTKGSHKGGGPFDSGDFDVDAFIVSDELAKQFPKGTWFRSGDAVSQLADIQKVIKTRLGKQFPGMRNEFSFRIYTNAEYLRKVAKDAHTIVK